MEKTISAGVLIVHKNTILACLPYGRKKVNKNCLDLPKGKVEIGETFEDAAVREVLEETGLSVDKNKLQYFGLFEYKPNKDLALYRYDISSSVDIKTLSCSTKFFNSKTGQDVLEHIGYEIVPFDKIEERFFVNLAKVIKKVI